MASSILWLRSSISYGDSYLVVLYKLMSLVDISSELKSKIFSELSSFVEDSGGTSDLDYRVFSTRIYKDLYDFGDGIDFVDLNVSFYSIYYFPPFSSSTEEGSEGFSLPVKLSSAIDILWIPYPYDPSPGISGNDFNFSKKILKDLVKNGAEVVEDVRFLYSVSIPNTDWICGIVKKPVVNYGLLDSQPANQDLPDIKEIWENKASEISEFVAMEEEAV